MGFGLLFIGYLFTFRIATQSSGFDFLPDIVGYLIMFAGLSKLALYGKGFRYAKLLLIPLIAAGGVTLVFQSLDLAGYSLNEIFTDISQATDIVTQIFLFAFHVALFVGIRDIARETDLPKVAFRAVRNLSITVFYYLVVLLSRLPVLGALPQRYVGLFVFLLGILWILMNLVLIFSCYMRICLEGDEEMPVKPSRFAVVNRMNAKIDAALDKTERVGKETAEYRRKKKKKKK